MAATANTNRLPDSGWTDPDCKYYGNIAHLFCEREILVTAPRHIGRQSPSRASIRGTTGDR